MASSIVTRQSIHHSLRTLSILNHGHNGGGGAFDLTRRLPTHTYLVPYPGQQPQSRFTSTLTGSTYGRNIGKSSASSWTTVRVALAVIATGTVTYFFGLSQPTPHASISGHALIDGPKAPRYGTKRDMENVRTGQFHTAPISHVNCLPL
jgi:hypothetical protein